MDDLETQKPTNQSIDTDDPQGITLPVDPLFESNAPHVPTLVPITPPTTTPITTSAIPDTESDEDFEPATRGQKAIQFLLFAGIGLVLAAGIVLLSGFWGDFSLPLRLTISAVGALVLAGAATVVATRAPGVRAMRETDLHSQHEGRRMLTAVLLAGTAAMVVFTILQWPTEPDNNSNPLTGEVLGPPYWTATIAVATGLIVAIVAAWIAPGVISTLVTWLLSVAFITTFLQVALWSTNFDEMNFRMNQWQTIILSAFGLVLAVGLSRYLRPAILAIALGVATWFFSGFSAAMEGEQFDDAPLTVAESTRALAEQTGNVGKVSLGVLLVLGVAMYLRRAEWPWPAGAVAALVGLTLAFTTNTLGVAAALMVAGAVLVLVSGALLFDSRRRARQRTAQRKAVSTST